MVGILWVLGLGMSGLGVDSCQYKAQVMCMACPLHLHRSLTNNQKACLRLGRLTG